MQGQVTLRGRCDSGLAAIVWGTASVLGQLHQPATFWRNMSRAASSTPASERWLGPRTPVRETPLASEQVGDDEVALTSTHRGGDGRLVGNMFIQPAARMFAATACARADAQRHANRRGSFVPSFQWQRELLARWSETRRAGPVHCPLLQSGMNPAFSRQCWFFFLLVVPAGRRCPQSIRCDIAAGRAGLFLDMPPCRTRGWGA